MALNTLSGADRLLAAVRLANTTQPGGRWLRVLLADPPIDWSEVRSTTDHRRWVEQRDPFAAELVEREVLARNRRALIVFGGGHLQRLNQQANYDMSSPLAQTLVSSLEHRAAGQVFVVRSEYDFAALQPDIATWPIPSLSTLAGTWLGEAVEPSSDTTRARILPDGRFVIVPTEQWASHALREQMDAILFLGPLTTVSRAPVSPARCADSAYIDTQIKRMTIAGVPPSVVAALRRTCSAP